MTLSSYKSNQGVNEPSTKSSSDSRIYRKNKRRINETELDPEKKVILVPCSSYGSYCLSHVAEMTFVFHQTRKWEEERTLLSIHQNTALQLGN